METIVRAEARGLWFNLQWLLAFHFLLLCLKQQTFHHYKYTVQSNRYSASILKISAIVQNMVSGKSSYFSLFLVKGAKPSGRGKYVWTLWSAFHERPH